MELVYPARLVAAEEGGYVVEFRDFPEAHTQGEDKEEALAEAADCLEEVLALYMMDRRAVPQPSKAKRGEHMVAPGSLIAAKTALYIALARAGLPQRALARRMGVEVTAVQRLLDPKHQSRHDQIDAALRALGQRLTVGVEEAA